MPKTTKTDRYDDVFPTRLRETLKEKKVTQAELGALLGCSNQSVSLYCNGNTQPKIEDIVKISQFLGVSVDYLFGLSDIRTTDPATKSLCETLGLSNDSVELLQNDPRAREVMNFLTTQHMIHLEEEEKVNERYSTDYVDSIVILLYEFLKTCDSQKDVLLHLTSSYNIGGEVILGRTVKSIQFEEQSEPIRDELGTVSLMRYVAMDKVEEIKMLLEEYLQHKYFKNIFERKFLLDIDNEETDEKP